MQCSARQFDWKCQWCGQRGLRSMMVGAARTAKQFLTYVNGGPFQPAIALVTSISTGWSFWVVSKTVPSISVPW